MAGKGVNGAGERLRTALAVADRLYADSTEEPLLPSINSGDVGRDPMPRPKLAVASLEPPARAIIENYFLASAESLAAELAEGRYLTTNEGGDAPLVITFTACSGSDFFCHCAYQSGVTALAPCEILHPKLLPFFALSMGTTTLTHYLHLIGLLYQRYNPDDKKPFAFLLRREDYPRIAVTRYWQYWGPRARYIRLRTANIERQSVSIYKAAIAEQRASVQPSARPPALDIRKLLGTYDTVLSDESWWDEFYEDRTRRASLTFFYEEFKIAPRCAVRELLHYLHRPLTEAAQAIRPETTPGAIRWDEADEILEDLVRSLREVTTRERVRRLYRLLLERPADERGLNHWAATAEARGYETILAAILRSDERRSLKARKKNSLSVRRAGKEPQGTLRKRYNRDAATTAVAIPGIGDLDLVLHDRPDVWISEPIRRGEIFDPHILPLLREFITPGSVFVDVGANIGWFTVIGSRLVGPGGQVIALEPDPRNYEILQRNIARNGCHNVTAYPVAAGAAEGTAWLYRSDDNQGDHRLSLVSERTDRVQVDVRRLDELPLLRAGRVDVVKIDTQGSEAAVLNGMHRLLSANPQVRLILEFWPYGLEDCGSSIAALKTALSRAPPRLWLLRHDGSSAPVTLQDVDRLARVEFAPATFRHAELVAVATEDEAAIQALQTRQNGGLDAPIAAKEAPPV